MANPTPITREHFNQADLATMDPHLPSLAELEALAPGELLKVIDKAQEHLPENRRRSLVSLARLCQEHRQNFFRAVEKKRTPKLSKPVRVRKPPQLSDNEAMSMMLGKPRWFIDARDMLSGVLVQAHASLLPQLRTVIRDAMVEALNAERPEPVEPPRP